MYIANPRPRSFLFYRKELVTLKRESISPHRDEKVRTESRLFHAVLAIEPDHEPEDPCQQKSENKSPSHITKPLFGRAGAAGTEARSEPHCGAGRERHRFHRGRNDHFPSPDRARTDHGGQSVGYGGNRTGGRCRHVRHGGRGDGAGARCARRLVARVPGSGGPAHGRVVHGIGPRGGRAGHRRDTFRGAVHRLVRNVFADERHGARVSRVARGDARSEAVPEGVPGTNPDELSRDPQLQEVHRYF